MGLMKSGHIFGRFRFSSGFGLGLLLFDRGEGTDEAPGNLVEGANESSHRCLHRAKQLGKQLIAAGQRRQGLYGGGIHDEIRHGTGLQDQFVVALGEVVEHLGASDRIVGNAVQKRSDQMAGQCFERRTGDRTTGQREFAPLLARCALTAGVDGLFIETHPDPDQAMSDGPNMIPLAEMAGLLKGFLKVRAAVR